MNDNTPHHRRLARPATTALAAVAIAAAFVVPAGAATLDPGVAAGTVTVAPTTDRLIIKYRNGTAAAQTPDVTTMAAAHAVAHRAGVQMTRLRGTAGAAQVMALDRRLDVATAANLAHAMTLVDATIEYAEPDLLLTKALVPDDPSYLSQWNYSESTAGINAPAAWAASTGSGVVVAVVDTGYRPHADLAANIVGGYDFIGTVAVGNDGNGRDASALDPGDAVVAGECGAGTPASASSWHGTHVAGTIAALTNNGLGVAGVAWGAKVLPVRVLGKCGGYTSDIADGVVWAAGGTVGGVPANPSPARVVSLSLGGSGSCGSTMQSAINTARARGALVVVAAGNSATAVGNSTPANCQGVVAVAAVNRLGGRAYYSNYGAGVAIAAPGGDMRSAATNGILSTLNTGSGAPGADSYAYYQGTSMATPHVSGVAALMFARNPALTVEQADALLRSSARAFPASCSGCGAGIVDAAAAVSAAAAAPAIGVTSVAETEPNGTLATAQAVSAPNAQVSGSLSSTADLDYYKVSVASGRTLTAVLAPNAAANLNLALYSSAGSSLGSSASGGNGVAERIVWSNTGSAAATVVVGVRWAGGAAGAYTLKLTQ